MTIFTDTYIKNLKAKDKRYEEYEGKGFGIRVSPNQLKSWIYRYKIGSKTDKLTLGHYPTMSLSAARKKHLELQELKRTGQAPKVIIQQQTEKKNDTLKKLITFWYNNYIVKHRKQPLQIKQQIDADIIPLLGTYEIEKIHPRDITKALDSIVQRGSPVHANKVLSTLKQVFNYAVSRGEISVNPAANIRSRDIGGLEKPRNRNLNLEEIKQIWLFLDSANHSLSIQIKNAIKIILLTGIRTGELRLATWSEFNFEKSLWIIPAEHNKNALVIKIHLSNLVKNLFLEIKECTLSKFVLAGVNDDEIIGDKSIAKAIQRIQDRIGIPEWTAHDLRRTFATQLGETLHIDPVVIEKCLGHKMPKIMATYNKNDMLPQRKDALEKWSEIVENLIAKPQHVTLKIIKENKIYA